MVQRLTRTTREWNRIDGGSNRRDHRRPIAQRAKIADREVRTGGSKCNLRQTLAATSGPKPAAAGVRSSVLNWRMGWDSNPRYACTYGGFQDRCLKPLGHPSQLRRTYAVTRRISSVDEAAPVTACVTFLPPLMLKAAS
jgi:hypothetical protein